MGFAHTQAAGIGSSKNHLPTERTCHSVGQIHLKNAFSGCGSRMVLPFVHDQQRGFEARSPEQQSGGAVFLSFRSKAASAAFVARASIMPPGGVLRVW
jgi:hypothetical protein